MNATFGNNKQCGIVELNSDSAKPKQFGLVFGKLSPSEHAFLPGLSCRWTDWARPISSYFWLTYY